ncbi:MAG: inositol monophosphatase family protein, partial [Mycobacteriales bacterium]
MTGLLEAVEELARLTGAVAARSFRTRLAVERKLDGSPVSAADREAETAARRWIGERFPEDGISGEEFGVTAGGARRRWVIDPIDGTISFLAGVPLYS